MSMMRWEPLRELTTVQQQMRRMLDEMFGATAAGGGETEDPARAWLPPMDVVERENELLFRFDLPGVARDDINIEIEDGTLVVSGERRSEHEERTDRFYRRERTVGSFTRSVPLPEGVDPERILADSRDGILELRVPKPERETRRKRITIGGVGGE